MTPLAYLFYFLFFHLTLLLPGYVFLVKQGRIKNHDELIAFSYVISLVAFSGLFLFGYLLKINSSVMMLASWLLLIIPGYYLFRDKLYRTFRPTLAWVVILVASLISIIYVTLPLQTTYKYIPDPQPVEGRVYEHAFNFKILNLAHTQANDNYIPFRQAQFLVNRLNIKTESFISEWSVNFFFRTPLTGVVSSYYFQLLGTDLPREYLWANPTPEANGAYIQFQILATTLNFLFVAFAFLLIKAMFNQKVASLTTLLVIFSPFFLYNSFFTWPKSFVAFFILGSWYLLFARRNIWVAGALAGLAYLTHDLAVLYLAGSVLFLLLSKRWLDTLRYLLVFVLIALPWLLIARLGYKQGSLFFYYPFSLYDIPLHPEQVIPEFFSTPATKILGIKYESLSYLITPYSLLKETSKTLLERIHVDSLYSIPGAVGLLLALFSYGGVIGSFVRRYKEILSFLLAPLLASIIVIGWPKGLGALHFAEAIIPLLAAFGIALLLKFGPKLLGLVVAGIVTQYFIVFFGIYNYDLTNWLTDPTTVAKLAVLAIAFVGTIWWGVKVWQEEPKTNSAQ
ncbi:MAG: glycosyltransferase family 39 protein [Candidatus Berkelbacteria bacterium]|nr:glycosyltransferase family 39 protein [Candidatus Berkelbacteria bacterium]